ncbi:hypothetical protein M3Y99_01617500 [Aphelenchoides fujianensis]|nr:hypothetical protein M3Y99_01617500 [Aphelenchoides fujianensis]
MIVFNTICVLGPGIIYAIVGFVPDEQKTSNCFFAFFATDKPAVFTFLTSRTEGSKAVRDEEGGPLIAAHAKAAKAEQKA